MDENKEKNIVWRKVILILMLVILSLCGIHGYNYYKSTPEYTLKIIADAMRTNNVGEFYRHVDLHSIIDDYYDVCMYYEIENNNNLNTSEKEMARDYIREMKASAVNELENELKNETIKGDNNSSQKEKNNNLKGFKYNGVKLEECMGKNRIITLDITDNETNERIFPKLRMMPLEDGTWMVVKIENVIDYYQMFKGTR